jgi:hypothetical protein
MAKEYMGVQDLSVVERRGNEKKVLQPLEP